ncbi:MAG: dynamin family protein [Planctomycetes bacterium]|nr:dynamin family protein [Planctomycetota bacterium]
MRTLLSQFCEEFDLAVRPLLDPLRKSTEILSERPQHVTAKSLLPGLLDATHQFRVLADKVAEQQAYVLIFGPLKSGKSTLMNAMSAAYVSEVTSLPAYPCMVYCSHSDDRKFVVTRYSGSQDTYHDPAALRIAVERAHTDLADHIRKVEAEGKSFDPAIHFPEAIRRIDVKVPAGDLAQSGSVLVDTPGLYSRMKFGYDRMTREFRNAAACAIFVVKTDNLFLEQVFEEFNQLLELFSRIFLVVNLDSTKKDLRADGTLTPSLESEDPIRIVQAFENLSMNAPLKAAADEGRLRIYPVDLQRAASRRLATKAGDAEAGESLGSERQADFDGFMNDLTEYLNSTDYLFAFLGDSLRRATSLLGEVDNATTHSTVTDLSREMTEMEQEEQRCNDRLAALGRLADYDWRDALSDLRDELVEVGRSRSESVLADSSHALSAAIDRWFQSDASLAGLISRELEPLFETCQRGLALEVHETLGNHVASGIAAVRLPARVSEDLRSAGLQFGEFGRGGLDSVDPTRAIQDTELPIRAADLPVKRSIWDLLLFRSKARVRRRILGPDQKPDNRIPRDVKAKRLGDPVRQLLQSRMNAFQAKRFPELLDRIALDLFEDYAGAVSASLQARIEASRSSLGTKLRDLRKELKESRRVLNRITDLAASADHARAMVEELSSRYSETDPHDLAQPVDSDSLIGLPFKEIVPQSPRSKQAPVETKVEPEILLEDAD